MEMNIHSIVHARAVFTHISLSHTRSHIHVHRIRRKRRKATLDFAAGMFADCKYKDGSESAPTRREICSGPG